MVVEKTPIQSPSHQACPAGMDLSLDYPWPIAAQTQGLQRDANFQGWEPSRACGPLSMMSALTPKGGPKGHERAAVRALGTTGSPGKQGLELDDALKRICGNWGPVGVQAEAEADIAPCS